MIKTDDLTVVSAIDYTGDERWMFYQQEESTYFFIYHNQVVAEAVLYDHFNHIRVYDFQVNYKLKRRGFGKAVISKILNYALANNKLGICGESTYEAYGFWSTLGASFDDEESYDDSDEILTPFKLETTKNLR